MIDLVDQNPVELRALRALVAAADHGSFRRKSDTYTEAEPGSDQDPHGCTNRYHRAAVQWSHDQADQGSPHGDHGPCAHHATYRRRRHVRL